MFQITTKGISPITAEDSDLLAIHCGLACCEGTVVDMLFIAAMQQVTLTSHQGGKKQCVRVYLLLHDWVCVRCLLNCKKCLGNCSLRNGTKTSTKNSEWCNAWNVKWGWCCFVANVFYCLRYLILFNARRDRIDHTCPCIPDSALCSPDNLVS